MQALKRNEQRAGVDAENALAHLLDANGDAIAVHGLEREGFENQHVESALDEIGGIVGRLIRHRGLPPYGQEEEYTSPSDCQEESGPRGNI